MYSVQAQWYQITWLDKVDNIVGKPVDIAMYDMYNLESKLSASAC